MFREFNKQWSSKECIHCILTAFKLSVTEFIRQIMVAKDRILVWVRHKVADTVSCVSPTLQFTGHKLSAYVFCMTQIFWLVACLHRYCPTRKKWGWRVTNGILKWKEWFNEIEGSKYGQRQVPFAFDTKTDCSLCVCLMFVWLDICEKD